MTPRTVVIPGNGTNVLTFTIPAEVDFNVESVVASVNAAAAGDTIGELAIAEVTGAVIATKRQGLPIPGGGSGTETWALRLTDEAATAAASGAFVQLDRAEFAATGVFDFQNIPQTFNHLLLIILAKIDFSSEVDGIVFNGGAGGGYDAVYFEANDTLGGSESSFVAQPSALIGGFAGNTGVGNVPEAASAYSVLIPEYRGTTFHKLVVSHGGYILSPIAPNPPEDTNVMLSRWLDTSAINRMAWSGSGGFLPGSTATLYGLL